MSVVQKRLEYVHPVLNALFSNHAPHAFNTLITGAGAINEALISNIIICMVST